MRTTVVYILRLLIDEREPEHLRGILRNVTSGEEQAFSSEQGLVELLRVAPQLTEKIIEENSTTQ